MRPFMVMLILAQFLDARSVMALEGRDLFLIVNRNEAASKKVADHYCAKRGVPKTNVLALDLPTSDEITRKDYEAKLVRPLREALKDRKDQVKVLLCIYGVPLRVGDNVPTASEKADFDRVRPEFQTAKAETERLEKEVRELEPRAKADAAGAGKRLTDAKVALKEAQARFEKLESLRRKLLHIETRASVDSELTLLWWDNYPLYRFQANMHYFQISDETRLKSPPVLMTARLDGPSPEIAMRLVDDALAVEKAGLQGKVYIDARGIRFDAKSHTGYGYEGYDESMRETARLLKDNAKMNVTLDDRNDLFRPNECPDCALYCGWYSHGKFIDSCRFNRGAVAWHLASSEAVTLRRKEHATLWCRNLLDKGVAATLGPVAEPYTIGFPKPAEFFGFLVTGEMTLVEAYSRSLLFNSWMMTLIGDPLYNPFKVTPRLTASQVVPSPKGGKFLLQPTK